MYETNSINNQRSSSRFYETEKNIFREKRSDGSFPFGNTKGLKKLKELLCLEYITSKEWAIDLGVSERTIQQWRSCGEIPEGRIFDVVRVGTKLARQARDRADDLLDFFIDDFLMQAYGASGFPGRPGRLLKQCGE